MSEIGQRMFAYYPPVIQNILEFRSLIAAECVEIDDLKSGITATVDNAYLQTMDEDRVEQWEEALGIVQLPNSSLADRREMIMATIRGNGKLNTALINTIVSSFTNGTANSYIKDSVLHVEILPPPGNKQYKFKNVDTALQNKIPAHLGLDVSRHYATWGEVKENYSNWNAIAQLDNWEEVNLYIPSNNRE